MDGGDGDFSNIHLKVGQDDDDALLPLERRAAITQFRVFARLRPFIAEELEAIGKQELRSTIEMEGDSTFPLDPNKNWKPSHEFVFDRSLWSIPKEQKLTPTPHFYHNKHETHTSQEDMYKIASVDENGISMVDNAFMGINSCILTYGQTSSGKTYTMMGRYGKDEPEEARGLIPRVCSELFQKVAERREMEAKKTDPAKRWELSVSVTFVEIYLEKVRDLLDKDLRHRRQAVRSVSNAGREAGDMQAALAAMKEANIRVDPITGPFVEGIEHIKVESWADCCKVLDRGSAHRTTAQTDVHDNSSRSHAVFTLTLLQRRKISEDRSGAQYEKKAGRINLVDLAGSERGGGTAYVSESAAINKSLMALRRVIDSLVERQEKIFERQAAELEGRQVANTALPHVPYLDSTLTKLLQDSIGGNAKTVMISNLTPYWKFYEETLRTLEWSQKAKKLVTVVRTNIDEAGLVKKNLKGHIGKMGADLTTTIATSNNLNEELANRLKLIEQLTKKNDNLALKIDDLKRRFEDNRQTQAATTIQLACYLYKFRKVKARREKQVGEAEDAASAAKKELRALEDKHEALVDALLRHNITMGRIKKKAEEVALSTDEAIAAAKDKEQKKPEELRQELSDRQEDVKKRRDELLGLQNDQQKAEELLQEYQEQREKDEKQREQDRLQSAEMAAKVKTDILNEILGANNDGEYASLLNGAVKLGEDEVPLFEMGLDGKWAPSGALEKQFAKIEQEKKDSENRLAEAQKDKKDAEETKKKLKNEVANEKTHQSKLNQQITKTNELLKAEKAKCCH